MSAPTDLDHHPDDARIAALLGERAAAVHPRGASPAVLARRATRIRRRRRTAALGAGLVATAAAGAFVVVARPERSTVETSVADGGGGAPPPGTAPTGLVVTAPPTTLRPAPSGPMPRLVLDAPGAAPRDVFDQPAGVAGDRPAGLALDLTDGVGHEVQILVQAGGPSVSGMAGAPASASRAVDLGGGRAAQIIQLPPMPDQVGSTQVLELRPADDVLLSLFGDGVSDDLLIDVARGLEYLDGPTLLVHTIPEGFTAGPVRDPVVFSSGASAGVNYDLPGGASASLRVSDDRGDGPFDEDLEQTRAAPTSTQYLRTVRGVDAIVRTTAGMTVVVWRESSGYLVELYVSSADPGAVVDEGIVDSVTEVDEATFQQLLADHPMVTTPHP